MDDRGGLVGRLIHRAAHFKSEGWDRTPKLLRAAAERIAALERALAGQLVLCPGCGGSGQEPDGSAPCRRCGAERAVLDGEGGRGDGDQS